MNVFGLEEETKKPEENLFSPRRTCKLRTQRVEMLITRGADMQSIQHTISSHFECIELNKIQTTHIPIQ